MPETPEKQGHGGRRPGAGRPPKHAEPFETVSVYVPSSTAARLRAHAAMTGRTVSEVVSAILESIDLGAPDTETHTPLSMHNGRIYSPDTSDGHSPESGYY